jgi:RNA 3'-terminal phosphate cyclase (ATP)
MASLGTLVIDGSHGEGGGQILRTAATLAAITGRAMRIERIRAGRPKPGMAAQHLTAIRAAAAICGAELEGDSLGSQTLAFTPRHRPQAGDYVFDVAAAREGGSAGAATLVIQAVLPALLLAQGPSTLSVRGGTHMIWSPPYDYLQDVWVPTLAGMGAEIEIELVRSGWYPIGQGEIRVGVRGLGVGRRLRAVQLLDRGPLSQVTGRAIAAQLPPHIAQRMADRATSLLNAAGLPARILPECMCAACPGAGIFLAAAYAHVACGFAAYGQIGKPAETVAEEAVDALLKHHASAGAVDMHLSDQLLVPFALADAPSSFTVGRVSLHLETNAWVIEQFGLARVEILRNTERPATVTVTPVASALMYE